MVESSSPNRQAQAAGRAEPRRWLGSREGKLKEQGLLAQAWLARAWLARARRVALVRASQARVVQQEETKVSASVAE